MRPTDTDQAKLLQISAACQDAIQAQRDRECRQGYGLDDYTEGRIVGAANLARKVLRVLSGGHVDAESLRSGPRKTIRQ